MYILTKLGQTTIVNVDNPHLRHPHSKNFKEIWKKFNNGTKQTVEDGIIKTLDSFGVSRNTFANGIRKFSLAEEYFKWEN